jgi:hypothetical protein
LGLNLSFFFAMKIRKLILLSLALLLPVCIFLFLKFFGKNQFDVPVLYDHGVTEKPVDCNGEYDSPYYLADSIFRTISTEKVPAYVINFSPEQKVVADRVMEEFSAADVKIISPDFSDEVKKCGLLLKKPYDVVLVDDKKQIRGYYVADKREEIDRLLIELSIILKKY